MPDNTRRFVDVFGYTLAESPRLSKHVQKMKNGGELRDEASRNGEPRDCLLID